MLQLLLLLLLQMSLLKALAAQSVCWQTAPAEVSHKFQA
jgi:hypothetical protein